MCSGKPGNEHLKEVFVRLIEDPKVKTLGQLQDITGTDLRTLMKVTGLSEVDVVGRFIFKKGISFLDPRSTEAKLIALGETS